LSGVDYDPQIKAILLDYVAVQYPSINEENFGISGDVDEDEAELRQKAAREAVAGSLANLIMTLPEFAIQR
jgi:hypothetical protein